MDAKWLVLGLSLLSLFIFGCIRQVPKISYSDIEIRDYNNLVESVLGGEHK
jgi:hypothetical protein